MEELENALNKSGKNYRDSEEAEGGTKIQQGAERGS